MLDYTVYLILGFIFIQKNYMKRLTVKISVMCLIVGAIGTIVLAKGYVVNGILTNLFWFGDSPFVILTSLGIYGLIMNIDIPTKFNTVVKSISDASFGIFFIHFIPLYLLTLVNISSKGLFLIIDPILGIPIITCILFLICYIIVSIIKKIPFIRIIT
jgi:surface polysaccharide O-acyltransferase-like enzyme